MGDHADRLADYVDVPARLAEFAAKYPDGRLRPVNPARPYTIETIGERVFVVYAAAAYRSPDDPLPGIGVAWEPFPGRTPYTRDSELQNAETSAWGRAIVAALIADAKKGVASREDLQNRGVPRLDERRPSDADVGRHPSAQPVLPSDQAIAKRAGELGFDDDTRRDVLAALSTSGKGLGPREVRRALEAFEGLASGSVELRYDPEGTPRLVRVRPAGPVPVRGSAGTGPAQPEGA